MENIDMKIEYLKRLQDNPENTHEERADKNARIKRVCDSIEPALGVGVNVQVDHSTFDGTDRSIICNALLDRLNLINRQPVTTLADEHIAYRNRIEDLIKYFK